MSRVAYVAATAALLVAPVAAPAATAARAPEPAREAPARPAQREVPGVVLLGMATGGLLIVGIAARRRQPGRSVSS